MPQVPLPTLRVPPERWKNGFFGKKMPQNRGFRANFMHAALLRTAKKQNQPPKTVFQPSYLSSDPPLKASLTEFSTLFLQKYDSEISDFTEKTGSVVRWERFLTLFLTLFPGKNTPVSGKSTVNLRHFSPKTHYFSSYLHNLPYPKYFSTIQTILIPRIGSRKRRKKGSRTKKGYKNISKR